jgi:hypothetical protein
MHFQKMFVQYMTYFMCIIVTFAALDVFSCTKLIRRYSTEIWMFLGFVWQPIYRHWGGVAGMCSAHKAALSKQSRRPVIITSAPICLPTGPFTPLCCPRNYMI